MFKKLIPAMALVLMTACGNATLQGYDGTELKPACTCCSCDSGICKDSKKDCGCSGGVCKH